MGRATALWMLFLVLLAAPAQAQQQRTCRQVLESTVRRLVDGRGQPIYYYQDPVRVLCTGGVRLEADSAIVTQSTSGVELVGNVVYQDSTRRLTADWANYSGRDAQLLARGDARVEDRADGAIITGQQLNYLRESEMRPTARLIVTGDRPHAVLPPPADSSGGAEPDSAEAPTHVWADRLVMEGDDFHAMGSVELERGEMTGAAARASYGREAERMTLTGDAWVSNATYRLEGDEIEASLEGEGLREVRSTGTARAVSDELDVRSELIRIAFVDGEIERLEAWNEAPELPRVRAGAEDFMLRADSMDARADSLGLRELRAVGRAYGERMTPDSTGTGTASASLPTGLARDWIQGDTILGFLEQVGLEGTDSTETRLERIEVVGDGSPALSLYKIEPEEGEGPPALNFMKARRIILFMEEGEVARVEAIGPIDGVYLDPGGRRGPGASAADGDGRDSAPGPVDSGGADSGDAAPGGGRAGAMTAGHRGSP